MNQLLNLKKILLIVFIINNNFITLIDEKNLLKKRKQQLEQEQKSQHQSSEQKNEAFVRIIGTIVGFGIVWGVGTFMNKDKVTPKSKCNFKTITETFDDYRKKNNTQVASLSKNELDDFEGIVKACTGIDINNIDDNICSNILNLLSKIINNNEISLKNERIQDKDGKFFSYSRLYYKKTILSEIIKALNVQKIDNFQEYTEAVMKTLLNLEINFISTDQTVLNNIANFHLIIVIINEYLLNKNNKIIADSEINIENIKINGNEYSYLTNNNTSLKTTFDKNFLKKVINSFLIINKNT